MTDKETTFLDATGHQIPQSVVNKHLLLFSRYMAYRLTIEVVRRVCSKRKKKVFNIKRTLKSYRNNFLVDNLSKRTKLLKLKRRNDVMQKELDFYYYLSKHVSPYYEWKEKC